MCSLPLLSRISRESYNDPVELYGILKSRGMDLVTVTDHDSIDAAEQLRSKPDFFLSEEVTATTPDGTEIHIGVYGIEDHHHCYMQARRHDLPSLVAYLREQNLLFSINHAFSGLTGRRTTDDFRYFADEFPAVETLNGHMLRAANTSAAAFAAQWRKNVVGGSDSHTLHALGRTYTEIPSARDASDFLQRLRHGQGRVYGESGGYLRITQAICGVGVNTARSNPWAGVLLPFLLLSPLFTLGNCFAEALFNYRWSRRAAQLGATGIEPAYVADLAA